MIYGNKALGLIELEDEIIIQEQLDQAVLNEMHFSKKDLQDPKTIEKITKREKQHESIASFLAILFLLICIIGPIVIGVAAGIIPFVLAESTMWFLFGNVMDILLTFPASLYDKNMKKYRTKVEKLKEQTEKKLKSNPDNAESCKKIIDNCDKVLKELDRLEKKSADRKYKAKIKEYTDIYQRIISMLDGTKDVFPVDGWDDIVEGVAIALDIKQKDFINSCIKSTKPGLLYDTGNSKDLWDTVEPWFSDKEHMEVSIRNNRDIMYDKFYPFLFGRNNDFMYLIHQKTKKIYLLEDDLISTNSIYDNYVVAPDMKILEDVDIALGYYRIAKCPPEVKQKKFPV